VGDAPAPADLDGAALDLAPVFEATAPESLGASGVASGVGEAAVRSVVGLGEGDG
jgi:hypothetical protein